MRQEIQTMSESIGYRKRLARDLAINSGMSVDVAYKIIEQTLNMISDLVAKEGRIELRNFGIFELFVKNPRKRRNPKTGDVVFVPKTYRVKFKPGKEMIEKIVKENTKKNDFGK